MVSHLCPGRSLGLALVAAALTVVAGCTSSGPAGLTTTAIVRLPSGFHAARPTDDATVTRATARALPAAVELAMLRLEGAHQRAAAALPATATSAATGGFVCQIDMGTVPLD
jgi:hypothetical protein